jgi:methylenetetrahydrofolate dehydrogenase (NADP+)/methenyltetrahydrofolate cyclohydrolase
MAEILSGREPAAALEAESLKIAEDLKKRHIIPTLALVRTGDNPDNIFYQRSIERTARRIGLKTVSWSASSYCDDDILQNKLKEFSRARHIHGILLFCPLAEKYNEKAARAAIAPEKDIDCLTLCNAGMVYAGEEKALPPCTPQAIIELFKYYKIPLKGQKAVILGRSLVVGKPLAMLLLKENATVTICHSQSRDLPRICREADILISAIGKAKYIGKEYMRGGQIMIDVGINPHPYKQGKYCGDLDFKAARAIASAVTPVPDGVGRLTTQMLCRHTLMACQWMADTENVTKNNGE